MAKKSNYYKWGIFITDRNTKKREIVAKVVAKGDAQTMATALDYHLHPDTNKFYDVIEMK